MATTRKTNLPSDARQRFRMIYDNICETASALVNAPAAVLTRRSPRGAIMVIGARGTSIKELDRRFVLPRLHIGSQPTLYVKDLPNDPDFRDHPILSVFPYCENVFALVVEGQRDEERAVLTILNPDGDLVSHPRMLESIHRLATITHGVMSLERRIAEREAAPATSTLTGALGLIDRGPIPAALIDQRGRIVHANHAFEDMFGKAQKAIEGRDFARLVHLTPPRGKWAPVTSPVFEIQLSIKPGHEAKCAFLPVVTEEGRFTAAILSPGGSPSQPVAHAELHEPEALEIQAVPHIAAEPTGYFLLKTLVKSVSLH